MRQSETFLERETKLWAPGGIPFFTLFFINICIISIIYIYIYIYTHTHTHTHEHPSAWNASFRLLWPRSEEANSLMSGSRALELFLDEGDRAPVAWLGGSCSLQTRDPFEAVLRCADVDGLGGGSGMESFSGVKLVVQLLSKGRTVHGHAGVENMHSPVKSFGVSMFCASGAG